MESSPEMMIPAKIYPGTFVMKFKNAKETRLQKLIKKRRSPIDPITGSITVEQLGKILFSAHGISKDIFHRTIPSAGATHPLEIYVISSLLK